MQGDLVGKMRIGRDIDAAHGKYPFQLGPQIFNLVVMLFRQEGDNAIHS